MVPVSGPGPSPGPDPGPGPGSGPGPIFPRPGPSPGPITWSIHVFSCICMYFHVFLVMFMDVLHVFYTVSINFHLSFGGFPPHSPCIVIDLMFISYILHEISYKIF